jgi:alpha/beta hydrolase family protein
MTRVPLLAALGLGAALLTQTNPDALGPTRVRDATTRDVGQPGSVAVASCDDFLLPPREVKGQKVGPASCAMQDNALTYEGHAFRRVDVGLDGTVDGYAARIGDYKDYFTNGPDLVFPQTWGPRPIFFGVAKYERAKGAAMTIMLPEAAAWNGRMFVMVHGRGTSFKEGNLKPWDRNFNPASPVGDLDRYDRLLMAKGYVVVKTHRTSSEGLGEITATLEDGGTVDSVAFNDTAHYVMDFAEVARALIVKRLGRAPVHMYMYGHSAGARIGHSLNYTPGLNVGRDGKRFFDGLLLDDPAAGTWYPVVMKDGKDVLLTLAADKAAFVPQIDVAHQMYNNIWPPQHPSWMSSSYLENKRNNARILRDKGIGNYRIYEVRGTSHSGGESLPDSMQRGDLQNIDLSKAYDRFIDILDGWVDKGTMPPPSHSDDPSLGDANHDGVLQHPALAFPEIACPLGVYYGYPNSTAGATAFAAFTGSGLEPLDANDVFVDMNRNGVWDYRETPTQAWRRLGLLRPTEPLTREKYVSCVTDAANRLRDEGFFSAKTASAYAEQATTTDLQPKQPTTIVIHRKKGEGG